MLQPSNRLTLIDAMRPPSGYEIGAAMAVTYTLDLRALLAAPAAFALGSTEGRADTADEPIELLHAVRRHADRITVFNQFGSIALPPSRKVFTFVEGSIVPVRAPRGGIVHPKVWVLRYERADADGPNDVHRVLISSRNLTFDESWDTLVRLDETLDDGTDLAGVADLFNGLVDNTLRPMTEAEEHRVADLGAAVRERRFAVPTGVDVVRIHPLGLDTRAVPFPARPDRSLVISPFLTDDFFTRLAPGPIDTLVSRPEAIDALADGTRAAITEVLTLDDGNADEPSPVSVEDDRSSTDPGRPLHGLHAKAFAFERGRRAHLFLGSANATGAAFRNNVEILIEFEADIDRLGMSALIDGNDDEPGLRRLLAAYVPRAEPDLDTDTDQLDSARNAIAELDISGRVERSGDGWAASYTSTQSLPLLDDTTVTCWPLPVPGSRRRIESGAPLGVRFETTVEAISGLLAFELEHDGVTTGFVVPVPMVGIPDERDRALLKALIGNAERFFRYLLALLEDSPTPVDDTRSRIDRLAGDDNNDPTTGLPVLERLLKTRRTDPAKLVSLHPLVSDLAADGILPDGFNELWDLLLAGTGLAPEDGAA